MRSDSKRLLAAIEAARIEARETWPGAYVSVVSYGRTDKGTLGWSMRVDIDHGMDTTRVLYAGPTMDDATDAVEFGRRDDLYAALRSRAQKACSTRTAPDCAGES